MEWIIDNWYVVLAFVAVLTCAGFAVYHFFGLPTDKQVAKVKEWLKYAVTLAEKELGGKTGQLKLRMVYDMFLSKFPAIANVISFELFSSWVDESLDWLNKQLESNQAINTVVKGE